MKANTDVIEVCESSQQTNSRPSRMALVAGVAALLVIGVVAGAMAFAYDASTLSEAADLGGTRRSCASTGLFIKAKSSGYYLEPGTNSGQSLSFKSPSDITSYGQIPKWSIEQTGSYFYIKTTSGMYLTLSTSNTASFTAYNALISMSTGSPGDMQKWKISVTSSSCGGMYTIRPKSYNSWYMQGGVWYPALTQTSGSDVKFYIEDSNGNNPCGTSASSCTSKMCQTGISVTWTNSTLTPNSNELNNIQTQALTACNNHCLTCKAWDYNCKSCGGTINEYGDMAYQNNTYTRQCDCNSAFKAASMSVASMLTVFAIMLKLQF